jgi:hypothetical protein
MAECPHCEYNKKRAHNWRVEAYRLAGHPLPEREQEPVGWIDSKGNMICTKINESCKPLYTTPQQRTWLGLTDAEILKFQDIVPNTLGYDLIQFAKAIESKLKEKNT